MSEHHQNDPQNSNFGNKISEGSVYAAHPENGRNTLNPPISCSAEDMIKIPQVAFKSLNLTSSLGFSILLSLALLLYLSF